MGAPSFDEFAAKASSLYPTATEAQIREAFAAKYSGDPVRTQGPTRDQFGARAEQLYPGVGTDQVDQAYEAKYGAPFLTETKRTLLSSAVAPMAKFGGAFLGGMDSMLDFAPGTGLFDRMGEATFNFGQRLQDENAPSADLQQRSNLNPYKLSQNVLGAAGQMLTQIPTMGAGSAALSIDDAAALEAENLKAGMSPAEARARAIGYAMVSGGLETVGLGRIVKRVPGRLAAGLTEAATEVGQGIARDVAGNNNPLTGLGDTLTGEGLPAFIVGAAFGKGPLRTPKEGETPAPQAEFEQNLAAAAGNDNPMGEPMSDLAAQGADVGTRRRGLYLAPEDAGKDPAPGLIRVPDGQGGEMLVATQEDAQAFQDEIGAAADEPARQAIIGAWTGAGDGKPPDSPDNLVVQQVDEAGNVTRESVVKPDQAEATRNKFAEIGRTVRIITPFEAVQRRMELRRAEVSRETKPADPIAPEPAPPVQAKDESPSDFAARQKAYLKGVVDMRPLPALADMPKDPTSYFTDEGDGIIPLDNLNRGKPEDASSASNGLKRMFAAARGQIAKRPPLTVQADGQGNLTVKDGNGTLGALKAAGLEGAPVRITLPIPDDAGTPDEVAAWRSYEKRLPGPWKKYLVGLARDAQAFLPDFRKGLEDIAQQVVGNRASPFKNPVPGAVVADIKSDGKKGWGRVAEKLIVEDNVEQTVPSADALKDMNRATLLVNTREQLQQALEETIGKFGLGAPKIRNTLLTARTFEDVVASDPYGYADVKINVAGPNGRIYEVQFATPELFAAKNGKGHKLYEEGRAREGLVRDKLRAIYGTRQMAIEDAAKAVEAGVRMFRGRDKRMLEIYAESQALYRAPIEAFLASSATRMNSASETSDPLARTAEGVENINPVVPQTMATGSQMTAGLPSTSQYVEPAGNIFAPLVTGNSVASESYEIKSPSGVAIQARERIADLDALVASDDPRFPAELQPRDRGKRASLSEQVRSIAENLDPRRLGKWWATDDGAPIVSPQGVVESGNGRTFALRVAREKYPERYAAYQAWLQDYAAKAGLDLGGLANPVLVQERVTPMDARTLRLFTGDANRSNKANLSASEVARVDAALLDARMLALLKSGDVTQAQNADFMAAFISALPVGEQNSLRTAGGQGSADGFRRAEAALIAYAYGPGVEVNPLLDRLYESGHDEPVRRLTNAMKAAAFKIAQLREAVQSGNVAIDYDIGKQIVLAYNAAREGLASGASWQSIIAQRDMMGDPLRDLVLQTFVKKDGKTPQTQDRIAAQLVYYGHQAQQQSQSQGGLFGDAVPAEDILQAALRDIGHSNRDLPDSVEFASRTGEAGRGMDAWNLRLAILRTLDSWNPDVAPVVRIVQSPGELPAHVLASLGPDINGAADLDNGVIYLVADNIPGPWAAQRVLLHEAVGHYGFMRLFGDRFEKIAEDVARLAEQDADVRRVARTVDEKYGSLDRNTRVAEIIAHLAETQPKHPLASQIIAAFREALRALGFRINLSKADLVHLIRKSADSMLDPSGPQGGRNQRYESDPARRWNVPAGRPFARQGEESIPNLIAQHNLSEDNLRYLLEEHDGQLPAPSIAISKLGGELEGFGEITLLGDADLIDPRGENRAKVFGADIYSPRYPKINSRYTMPPKDVAEKLLMSKALSKAVLAGGVDIEGTGISSINMMNMGRWIESMLDSDEAPSVIADRAGGWPVYVLGAIRAGIPREKALDVLTNTVRDGIARIRSRYIKMGINPDAMVPLDLFNQGFSDEVLKRLSALRESGDSRSRIIDLGREAIREYTGRIGVKKRIFVGYRDSGDRKYLQFTMANIVKLMKKNLRGGENENNVYGVGQARAYVTKQFTSRKQISANKELLVNRADFHEVRKQADERLKDFAGKHFGHDLSAALDFVVSRVKTGFDAAVREHEGYGNIVKDPEVRKSLRAETDVFVDWLRRMPTEYFEVKIPDAVPLSKFRVAVVPNDFNPELRDALERYGVKVHEYNDVEVERTAAVAEAAKQERLVFASRPSGPHYNNAQGKLDFLDAPLQKQLELVPLREDTTQEQIDLGIYALEDLFTVEDQQRGARVRALGIARDFFPKGSISLVGNVARDHVDIARLAQAFRDPRFETLRIILVKDDKIVQQFGVSSRLPGTVYWETDKSPGHIPLAKRLADKIRQFKATSWYAVHNHPSGRPDASDGDIGWTAETMQLLEHEDISGEAFGGHIIVDHNKYGLITGGRLTTPEGRVSKTTKSVEFFAKPEPGGYVPGYDLNFPEDYRKNAKIPEQTLGLTRTAIARNAFRLYRDSQGDAFSTVVAVDYNGRVSSVSDIPNEWFADALKRGKYKELEERLRRIHRNSGADQLILVTKTGTRIPRGLFLETIEVNNGGVVSYGEVDPNAVSRAREGFYYRESKDSSRSVRVSESGPKYATLASTHATMMEKFDRDLAAAQTAYDKAPTRETADALYRLKYERKKALANFRAWAERKQQQATKQAPAPATDEFGRQKDEQGRTLDWNGNPIPEGQQELPGFTQVPDAPTQDFNLEAPQGQVGAGPSRAPQVTGQRGLFASRPGSQVAPPDRVQVGGGDYSLAQFGRLNPQELNVLTSVMNTLEEPVEYQRRGTRPWSATEQAALDMLQQKFGLTLSSLVNRKQGSAANAEQLEAYGILIAEASRNIRQLAEQVAATRNPTSDDLARLASAREKLGMLIAPAMGYRSEAGRSLNILKKMSADMRTADGLLEAMGDGTEETLKDFARRVNQAGSIDQIVGVTRTSYTPTWWDKFYEYWINGLLSGPTTHSVNIFSNGLFMALEQGAEFVASASGAVSPRAAAARVAAIPHGVTMGLKNGLEAFLTEQAITTPEGTNEQNRKAIGGTLGKVVRIPGRALQAEDEFFKSIAYQGQLSALAMEQAIREAPDAPMERFREIMGAPTADLIKSARAHAARMTFTTPLGPLGASITAVLNKSKVGRIIVPFVRTPTNILKRALEYTPGAPLMEQVRNDLMGRSGAASPQGELFGQPESPDAVAKRAQAMAWSRMAVGSSIMLGVVSLAAQGMLSGAGPDDDDERALLMRQGWRPYSVRLEDGSWIRYNRFEPFGMLMGLAADFAEIGGALSAGEIDKIGSMLMTSLATNLGDKTFLRGITEFSQAYADPKRYMQRWAQSMAASPIPNVAAQTARYLDPYQREARTLVDSWKAKIPGMTTDLAQRLDIAGEPIKRDTGIPGNPFQVSEPKQDALAKAMVRLGVNKGAPSRTIQAGGNAFKLGDQDYQAFKGYVQKARWSILTPLVNSPQFRDLEARNPAAAQQILDKQYEDIGRQARTAWIFKNPHALSARKGERSTTLANSYQ